jgi:hypothetical protein
MKAFDVPTPEELIQKETLKQQRLSRAGDKEPM